MASRPVFHSEVWQGETIVSRAQIVLDSGSAMTSTVVTSWSLNVYDRSDPTSPAVPVYTLTLQPVGTTVFAAYQTSGWSQDSVGYNWAVAVTSAAFAQQGGHTYGFEFVLSTSTDGPIALVHECAVKALSSV